MSDVFKTLVALNVNEHTEKKSNGYISLTYLSWTWAVKAVKERYPDMTYEVVRFENGLPYVYDEKTGYMVFTRVTIEGQTHEMWLPVMDGANKAMKSEPYTYKTRNGEKTVEAATMFDVNTAIMRCLVKNLAMFGLGLYIYAGEDLPQKSEDEVAMDKELSKKISKKEVDQINNTLKPNQIDYILGQLKKEKVEDLTKEEFGNIFRSLAAKEGK